MKISYKELKNLREQYALYRAFAMEVLLEDSGLAVWNEERFKDIVREADFDREEYLGDDN